MYQDLNERVRKGQRGNTKAQEELLEEFHPLILSSIKKYCPIVQEQEDLYQDGCIVFLQALKDYNPKVGVHFPAYAKSCLRFYYLETFRFLTKEKPLSLNYEGEEGETLEDQIPSEETTEEWFLKEQEKEELYVALATLSKRQEQILRLFYLEELSLSEISGYLGIAYSTVANIKTQGLKQLRRYYASK